MISGIFPPAGASGGNSNRPYRTVPSSALNSRYFGARRPYSAISSFAFHTGLHATHLAQCDARRCLRPEIHVRIVPAIVAEVGPVLALFRGQSLESRPVELHRKNLHLPRIIFIR